MLPNLINMIKTRLIPDVGRINMYFNNELPPTICINNQKSDLAPE